MRKKLPRRRPSRPSNAFQPGPPGGPLPDAGQPRVARRLYMAGLAALCGLAASSLATPAWAQVFFTRPSQAVMSHRPITLKDILAKELKARRSQEFAFIDQVVRMVEQGQLPVRLVRASLLWSRNKRPYPMIYFEQSLRRQAARVGIVIPR